MRFFDIVLFQDFLSLLSLQLYYFSISLFLNIIGTDCELYQSDILIICGNKG